MLHGVVDLVLQFGAVPWAGAGEEVVLGVTPDPLVGVELRCVGWQKDELEAAVAREPLRHAAVRGETVPDEGHRAAACALNAADEALDRVGVEVAPRQLEREGDAVRDRRDGDGADDRDAVVAGTADQLRGLSLRRPRRTGDGLEHESALICHGKHAASAPGFFFMRGHSSRRNRSTSARSCSRARRTALCGLKSIRRRSLWTFAIEYVTPSSLAMTDRTRRRVHRSLSNPLARAPMCRITRSLASSTSPRRTLPPALGIGSSAATPPSRNIFDHLATDPGAQSSSSATSRIESPRWCIATPNLRRCSSSALLPVGLIRRRDHERRRSSIPRSDLFMEWKISNSVEIWSAQMGAVVCRRVDPAKVLIQGRSYVQVAHFRAVTLEA